MTHKEQPPSILPPFAKNIQENDASTPRGELLRQLLDPNIPKNEREHCAAREITDLRKDLTRIDWLEKMCACIKFVTEDEGSLPFARVSIPVFGGGWQVVGEGDDYRDAIDDAASNMDRIRRTSLDKISDNAVGSKLTDQENDFVYGHE